MNKEQTLLLIERSLGLKHKLKVHDTISLPETHEELAKVLLSRWELEDELAVIEQLLVDIRNENKKTIQKNIAQKGIIKKRKLS